MTKPELDNLVRINKLKLEPARRAEFDGMAPRPEPISPTRKTTASAPTAGSILESHFYRDQSLTFVALT